MAWPMPQLWEMSSPLTAEDSRSRGTRRGLQLGEIFRETPQLPRPGRDYSLSQFPSPLSQPEISSLPCQAPPTQRGVRRGGLRSPGRPQHTGEVAMPAQFPPPSSGSRGQQLAASQGAPRLMQWTKSHGISPEAGPRWWVQVRGVACLPVL